ncbi:MAG: hypothetical protein LW875_11665, partial [Proteobacteria bacterium]|nr:hypothetical protein [Pseudomonadota bacterium]
MLFRKAALVFAILFVIMVGFQNCAKVTFDGADLSSLGEVCDLGALTSAQIRVSTVDTGNMSSNQIQQMMAGVGNTSWQTITGDSTFLYNKMIMVWLDASMQSQFQKQNVTWNFSKNETSMGGTQGFSGYMPLNNEKFTPGRYKVEMNVAKAGCIAAAEDLSNENFVYEFFLNQAWAQQILRRTVVVEFNVSQPNGPDQCDQWVRNLSLVADDPKAVKQNVEFRFNSRSGSFQCAQYSSIWRYGDGAVDGTGQGLNQILQKLHAYENPGKYLSQVTLNFGPNLMTQANFYKPISIYRNSQSCDLNSDLYVTGPQLINRGQSATYQLVVPPQCKTEVRAVNFVADGASCQRTGVQSENLYSGAFDSLPCETTNSFLLSVNVQANSGDFVLQYPVQVVNDLACKPDELLRLFISGPNQVSLGESSQFSLIVPDCMKVQNFQAASISWVTEPADGGSGSGQNFQNQFAKAGWYKVHADIPSTRYFAPHRVSTNVYVRAAAPATTTTVPATTTTVPATTTTVPATTTTVPATTTTVPATTTTVP